MCPVPFACGPNYAASGWEQLAAQNISYVPGELVWISDSNEIERIAWLDIL